MKIKYVLESLINGIKDKEMDIAKQHLQAALLEINYLENRKQKKENASPKQKWELDLAKGQLKNSWSAPTVVPWQNPIAAKNALTAIEDMIEIENKNLEKKIEPIITPNQQFNG